MSPYGVRLESYFRESGHLFLSPRPGHARALRSSPYVMQTAHRRGRRRGLGVCRVKGALATGDSREENEEAGDSCDGELKVMGELGHMYGEYDE